MSIARSLVHHVGVKTGESITGRSRDPWQVVGRLESECGAAQVKLRYGDMCRPRDVCNLWFLSQHALSLFIYVESNSNSS